MSDPSDPVQAARSVTLPDAPAPSQTLSVPDLSHWRRGNTTTEGVWHFTSGIPGRHVLLTAIIHGNELCGAWALKDLLEASIRPKRGSLTLAFCNLAAFDRFDAKEVDSSRFVEQDMNRVWDDALLAAGTSLESRRAAEIAQYVREADWLLDLHSMHERSPPLMLAGLQSRNLELARQIASPEHIVIDGGHSNGVRMRDYGSFGDAADQRTRSLLIECGLHTDPASRAVARDVVFRFLVQAATIDAADWPDLERRWKQADAARQWVLEVTEAIVAKSSRFHFARSFTGLEVLHEEASLVGWNDGEPVRTPYRDCVLVMPSRRQASRGVTVVRFARRHPA